MDDTQTLGYARIWVSSYLFLSNHNNMFIKQKHVDTHILSLRSTARIEVIGYQMLHRMQALKHDGSADPGNLKLE
eukprot:3650598-Karenia_brevis.AAC.1